MHTSRFRVPSADFLHERLQLPREGERLRVVLDTDTYNEVDDQFAVVHAIRSPDRIGLEAIYAAPFLNERSNDAGDGMEKSYAEILRLLGALDVDAGGLVHRGSPRFMSAPDEPVDSPAARDLVRRAMHGPAGVPLYVVAIGAPTNVASALLMESDLIERVVVVWLGGQPHHARSAREFNLQQDLHASRILFDSGVPLVQVPCGGVASHMLTTVPELETYLRGRSAIADMLLDLFRAYRDDHFAWSKEIWDVAATAWVVNPAWAPTAIVPAPRLTDEHTWDLDPTRHPMRVATSVRRDAIFKDLFQKLAR